MATFEAILQYSPDITIVDLRLPKMAGLELLAKVSNARPKTRVVIFTESNEDRDLLAALSCGVHGIIMKESTADDLIRCLRSVCAGGRCLPQELVRKQRDRLSQAAFINAALTSQTAKLHLHHIYCKAGVSCRSALLRLALYLGSSLGNQSWESDEKPARSRVDTPSLNGSRRGTAEPCSRCHAQPRMAAGA